jgi:Arc/MetJ family transcription regulator
MAKHLVDIDDEVLGAARAELGTATIKETVNEALRRVSHGRRKGVSRAIDVLVRAKLEDRDRAWR